MRSAVTTVTDWGVSRSGVLVFVPAPLRFAMYPCTGPVAVSAVTPAPELAASALDGARCACRRRVDVCAVDRARTGAERAAGREGESTTTGGNADCAMACVEMMPTSEGPEHSTKYEAALTRTARDARNLIELIFFFLPQ